MADTELFQVRPGRVTKITPATGGSVPRLLTLTIGTQSTPAGGNPPLEVGITQSFTVILRVQEQTQLGLNGGVFTTAFGDQPGQYQLQTVLNISCDETGSIIGDGPVDKYFRYYNQYKLKPSANLEPLYIGVGSTVLRGYLVGMQLNAAAQQSQVFAGTLTFKTITTGA